jgi:hypothetical protein
VISDQETTAAFKIFRPPLEVRMPDCWQLASDP